MFLGMSQESADSMGYRGANEGTKLRVGGTSDFEALLTGFCWHNHFFNGLDKSGVFWTSTVGYVENDYWPLRRSLSYMDTRINRSYYHKSYGISVRCVKDNI